MAVCGVAPSVRLSLQLNSVIGIDEDAQCTLLHKLGGDGIFLFGPVELNDGVLWPYSL